MSDGGAQLEIHDIDGGLQAAGEVDAHTAPSLQSRLEPLVAGGGEVRLDIAGVTFMDSSGLRVIIDGTERLRAAGGDLVLVAPTDLVRRLFDVSGLTDHLTVADR